ncbi:hypothetical protein [Emcibacter sp.]|uniref:hypothetical protein n=1 Tax=Emcibacter sp. TaxID=1979954 RepID=UPI002AA60BFD|nr:hypothetical protein [Emcibacter sp.]
MTSSNLFGPDQPSGNALPEQFDICKIPKFELFKQSFALPFSDMKLLLLSVGVFLVPMLVYFAGLVLASVVGPITAVLVIPLFILMLMGMGGIMNEWIRKGLGFSQKYPTGIKRFYSGVWGNIGRLILIGIIGGFSSLIIFFLLSAIMTNFMGVHLFPTVGGKQELQVIFRQLFIYGAVMTLIFAFVLSYIFSRFGVDLVTGAMNEKNKLQAQERVPFDAKLKGIFLPLSATYVLASLLSVGISMIPVMIMTWEPRAGVYQSLGEAAMIKSSLSWIMLPISLLNILVSFYIFAVFSSMFGLAFRYRFGLTDEILEAIDRK